ncbi:MAG: spore maturation protein [Bacilli bacterium]|nr:spore maturation protein [Bacilli bacterium]
MVSIIWAVLIFLGVFYYLFTGNIEALNNEVLTNSKKALELMLELMPVIVLWTGLMKIAEDSGLLFKFAKFLSPFLRKLFPEVKKDSLALGYIASNIAANMLGLGSAATPFGLKAMDELQKENPNKKEASTPMITFLVLNTAGVTIIPTTILAMRVMYNSANPEEIILPAILATAISSISGLTLDYFIRRKKK